MVQTYTKEVIKELNEIKDTLGISAFERLIDLFLKMSEQYNYTCNSRDKWRVRAEKAEKELKKNPYIDANE